eukprot:TRINITY_DN6072_c0_g1_i1.p1 TRINITY_DN6072_c0_g1~~TRINITY_DN6072_c0_g1_i1.p1  ORF type:complete len:126 (-),score=16.54 TRINITY_DN6072_c0_g1_i1:692-1069(-)
MSTDPTILFLTFLLYTVNSELFIPDHTCHNPDSVSVAFVNKQAKRVILQPPSRATDQSGSTSLENGDVFQFCVDYPSVVKMTQVDEGNVRSALVDVSDAVEKGGAMVAITKGGVRIYYPEERTDL